MEDEEKKPKMIKLKEEEENEEEDEEEDEDMVIPKFIPKSERILSKKEEEKKMVKYIKNETCKKKEVNTNTNIDNKNNKDEKNNKDDNKQKVEQNVNKDSNINDNNNNENKDIKEKKEDDKNKKDKVNKKEKENDILNDNILSIRNSLDRIHQQNIKYLIELEKKKNEKIKKNIIQLDAEDNDNKIGKPKKLKSQQEKIYIHLPDDTDDQNDINEYNNWKERELKRIKRDIEKYEQYIKEQEEIKKRRIMTENEIKEDNIRLGADSTKNRFRSKISFLQKYYHKGVFFQDEAEDDPNHIYNRDFNLPTWEDTVDKSNLPKILAKRRGNAFKKSQSKYTHLNDADTTSFDKNFIVPETILSKIQKLRTKK